MKKLIVTLLTVAAILSLFAGCRRQNNENPGDPTVNNTTEENTAPSTTQATRPSTEPTIQPTIPDGTDATGNDFTDGSDFSNDATINSESRRRDRMLPRR